MTYGEQLEQASLRTRVVDKGAAAQVRQRLIGPPPRVNPEYWKVAVEIAVQLSRITEKLDQLTEAVERLKETSTD